MANAVRGELAFEADGEALTMRLDVNALCDLETLLPGRATPELVSALTGGNMTVTRAFLWAGLKAAGHDHSLLEAGDVVSALGPAKAQELVLEAVRIAFPKTEAGKAAGDPPGRRRGTGKSSSGNG